MNINLGLSTRNDTIDSEELLARYDTIAAEGRSHLLSLIELNSGRMARAKVLVAKVILSSERAFGVAPGLVLKTSTEIKGRKQQPIADARTCCCRYLRLKTDLTLAELGLMLGMTHCSVHVAAARCLRHIETSNDYRKRWEAMVKGIES